MDTTLDDPRMTIQFHGVRHSSFNDPPDLLAVLTSTAAALAVGFGLLIVRVLWLSWKLRQLKADNYAAQHWELTLERLRPWDSLKASHDIVVERCGGETAIYLLYSRYGAFTLTAALLYALAVLMAERLMAADDDSNHTHAALVWAHLGLALVCALVTVLLRCAVMPTYRKYFVTNKRWSRSLLAARSLKLDGLLSSTGAAGQFSCDELKYTLASQLSSLKHEGVGVAIHVAPDHRRCSQLLEERQQLVSNGSPQGRSADLLEALDTQVEELRFDEPAGVAFVEFPTIEMAERCLHSFPELDSSFADCSAEAAPDPSDVIWASLGTPKKQRMMRALMVTPCACIGLIVAMLVPISVANLLVVEMASYWFWLQTLPALVLAGFNLWLLPTALYRLIHSEAHHSISAFEKSFLLKYSVCMLLSSFLLPSMSLALAQWMSGHQGVQPGLSWLEMLGVWLGSVHAEIFFMEYLALGVIVILLDAGKPASNGAASGLGSTMSDNFDSAHPAEECEVFLGANRSSYAMPTQAVRSKPYQYAVVIHIQCIALSFGSRSPWVLVAGATFAGLKYFLDKVAEFRFFSDPVAQLQVRPRFLRRGGEHLALLAIQLHCALPVVVMGFFALAVETNRWDWQLSRQVAGALWGVSALVVSIVVICVVIWAPDRETEVATKSSRFGRGSWHYNIDAPREGFQESYAFPQANYGSPVGMGVGNHNYGSATTNL